MASTFLAHVHVAAAALQNILPVARVADLALIAPAAECVDALEMPRVRAFVMLQQVISDLIDQPGSLRRGESAVLVSIDDLLCSLLHTACIRTNTIAALPGDTAKVAELRLTTAAKSESAYRIDHDLKAKDAKKSTHVI